MKKSQIFRLVCIALLWTIFCWWYVTGLMAAADAGDAKVTLMTLWPLPVSAIIVFVPLYKKYKRNGKDSK